MEKHKITISNKDVITIVPFGDVHLGSPNCDWNKFWRFIKWAEKEDLYLIGMGDIFDVILATDKRYSAEERQLPLLNAIDTIVKTLEPLAKQGKIIGLHRGNHEQKMADIGVGDPILNVCARLGVKFLGYSSFIKIVAKRGFKKGVEVNTLVIYSHHGFFSGRKRGSKINNLEDLSTYWIADLYLVAHSHDLFSSKRVCIDFNGQHERAFLNTGAFLKTAEIGTCNYSERAGYPPQKLGIARIEWQPFKTKCVETGRQRGDLHIID